MEEEYTYPINKENNVNDATRTYKVHRVLAFSYSFYFIALVVGIVLDFLYPIKLFENDLRVPLGFLLLIISTMLILWAQKTSRDLRVKSITKEAFTSGPYRYTRTPTHWGLFLLALGFGITANATFIICLSVISFIVTKFVFLKQEEDILAEKYGAPYIEYKKSVKF